MADRHKRQPLSVQLQAADRAVIEALGEVAVCLYLASQFAEEAAEAATAARLISLLSPPRS